MDSKVATLDGKSDGSIVLPDTIFGLEPRADILQRMVRWQLAKRQAGTHKTKRRGEIAMTTKKFGNQKGGGRGDTWAVLNHEGFHQYIFYFFGAISPHSWYNEGTGAYYSGYEWKTNRFVLQKFQWRTGTITEAIREGTHVPLDQFVRFSQREYYGTNKLGVDGGQNYAQGWSLIYFLRTGKKNNAKGWNAAWARWSSRKATW